MPTTEQFLDVHYGIQTIPSQHEVRIKGRILPKNGFRTCDLSARGNRVEKGRWLRFDVTSCDVPKPSEVYWKVRNTGEEAARVGQLRGEITRDAGSETKRESTAYRGSHYVECLVVRNGTCVAADEHFIYVV